MWQLRVMYFWNKNNNFFFKSNQMVHIRLGIACHGGSSFEISSLKTKVCSWNFTEKKMFQNLHIIFFLLLKNVQQHGKKNFLSFTLSLFMMIFHAWKWLVKKKKIFLQILPSMINHTKKCLKKINEIDFVFNHQTSLF